MPRRIALVVGVSRYHSFSQLPTAARDAETMAHVLKHVAGFDEVLVLADPDATKLAEASEYLFADKEPGDLVLLYFSGHGVKDERGQLHLAVPNTRKHASGELVRATAVSCRHIHDTMSASRSRRQVVILDCCFSGAFAEGIAPKDGGHVDLRGQLGGEGRVVLASSGSTQYSFDASTSGLSTYTQFIVHGIASGEADLNHDGQITVDELHEYARARVQASQPAMNPQILPTREGYTIVISAALKADPRRAYAAKVREVADRSGGLSRVTRQILALRRAQLGLQEHETDSIETTELEPRRVHAESRATLRQAVYEARSRGRVAHERVILNELRVALNLGEQDLQNLLIEPIGVQRAKVLGWRQWPQRLLIYACVGAAIMALGWLLTAWMSKKDTPKVSAPSGVASASQLTEARPSVAASGSTVEVDRPTVKDISAPTSRTGEFGLDGLPPAPSGEAPSNPDITGTSWVLRLTSNYSLEEATELASRVAGQSLEGQILRPQIVRRGSYFCILIGPYDSEYEAERLLPAAKNLLNKGGYVQSMARWCPYPGEQRNGYRRCE